MANKKVLYFTADAVASGPELTAIGKLNALVGYDVGVRNSLVANTYGAGVEDADYVAGTLVAPYDDAGDFPVINPDVPPAPVVGSTQKVITSGVAVTGVTLVGTAGAGKSMALTIVAGVVTTATFT